MSNSYVLLNPYVQGEFKTTLKAKNSVEAGKEFYSSLSEHFNNAVPKFYFTIQKGHSGQGKYYHFRVSEKRNKNDVSFTLEPYEIVGTSEKEITDFSTRLNEFKNNFAQSGGKKKKHRKSKHSDTDDKSSESSSDSSESSSYNYKKVNTYISTVNQPIYYWWYDPSIYRLNTYYVPTFYSYVTPVIEIALGFGVP